MAERVDAVRDHMIRVLDPGPLTTVQDLGRPGQLRFGIPPSGPMDRETFVLANRLVGNPDGDSISMQLISPQRVEIEVRRRGQRSATAVSAVSPNRIRMERHRLPLSGNPSDDMLVYDRVR